MNEKYLIEWSEEDQVYTAKCNKTSIKAHGETPEKALAELRIALEDEE